MKLSNTVAIWLKSGGAASFMGAACGGGKKASDAVQLPLPGDDFVQRVVVCRHANREDHLHPKAWFGSPEGMRLSLV